MSQLVNYRRITQLIGMLSLLNWQVAISQRPATLTVYVFLNTECPISQQYAIPLTKLYKRFSPSGVRFIAIFPLRTDSPAVIEQFRSDYKLPFSGQSDRGGQLAKQFHVHVTPEVVVLESTGRVKYQGAIDNWYVELGRHRTEATEQYLGNALNALLSGGSVLLSRTDAVGCLIE